MAQPVLENNGETVLVPRVKSFTNQYITKSDYTGLETKITKVAVLVFDSDNKLVHLDEVSGESVILNKSMLNSSARQTEKLKSATVVMFANMDLADIKKEEASIIDNKTDLTPDDLENYTCHFAADKTVIPAPLTKDFEGFPMVGSTTCDLSATKDKSDPITVDLKILYAKVNFSITAESGTENDEYEGVNVAFELNEYSVHNASRATKLDDITASEEIPDAATESRTYAFDTDTDANTWEPDENQFTFYVAENRYNPYTGSKPDYPDYASLSEMGTIYPSDWLTPDSELDVKDQTVDQPNGVKYFYDDLIQQYKPNLVEKAPTTAGKPTYVTLTGVYTDYRGTLWDVDYDIYLGKDNAHNFHVDRNSEYTNYITIKGIRNNGSYGEGQVWVDHRVDVEDTEDLTSHIFITRETLIDSHFEVRPLRVSLPANIGRVLLYLPKYIEDNEDNWVQIEETENGTGENWIAVENNNGRVKDITQFSSNGKRKYFTTSLIKQLYLENNDEKYGIKINELENDPRNGQKFIQLFDGDCAWIYIDENASEQMRTAKIELVFYDTDFNELDETEVFIIKQKGLHKVGNYYVEEYEEYLHTYDSQDLYTDPTKDYTQRGYNWGLLNNDGTGIRISNSQYVRRYTLGSPNTDYPYDYFHSEDAAEYSSYTVMDVSANSIDLSGNTGLNFTNNAGISQEMTIIDMSTRPESAIQYCLSKNKFRVDESDQELHKMDIHWYLPDAYEMAQILTDGQEIFADFKDNAYWTSQPSSRTTDVSDGLAYGYLLEDTDNARTVSLNLDGSVYHGTHTDRSELHRIRCAYSKSGIDTVNFSGARAPEGIGAMRFYMRAWKDWNTGEKGYFNWLPKSDTIENVVKYTLPDTYDFPKDVSGTDQYFGKFVEGYGFEEDPSDSDNWDTETVSVYTSQVALHRWPGLTTSQVVERTTTVGNQKYYVLESTKEETNGIDSTFRSAYTKDITQETLKPLDHLFENTDLSIVFLKGDNTANSPSYKYEKVNKVISKKTTRTWETPKYATKYKTDKATYDITTPSDIVQLTSSEESRRKRYNGTISTNPDGYIYTSSEDAKNAGSNIVLPEGAIDPEVNTSSSYVTIYTVYNIPTLAIRWRYTVTYSLDGQQVPYYYYESGGKWVEVSQGQEQDNTSPPTADQLTLYGGNSFTIKANNGNVISSVKIYFSDSNIVDESSNLIGNTVNKYLRFTKDGFTGTEDPPGMSYSGDGETGTMIWSGDPTNEITFELMSYQKTYDSLLDVWWGAPSSSEYKDSDSESFEHSIVIDQIDVRYKKAD